MVLAGAVATVLAGGAGAAGPPPGTEACDACHGPGGNSQQAQLPSIAGQPRIFLENQLVLIREGLRDIPQMRAVMGNLSDEQIIALATHYAGQPVVPSAAPRRPAAFDAGAAVAARALCGTCHLPDYVGQGQVPRLAGQQEPYLLATMKMYRDNPEPGRDTAMSAALIGLNDDDLAALAHYMAQQGRR